MKIVQLDDLRPEGLAHDPDIIKRVLLREDELPASVRLSHAVFKPGQKASAHTHDDLIEVFYLLSGSAEVIVNGVAHALKQGGCLRVDAGETHELINAGVNDMAVIYFGLKIE